MTGVSGRKEMSGTDTELWRRERDERARAAQSKLVAGISSAVEAVAFAAIGVTLTDFPALIVVVLAGVIALVLTPLSFYAQYWYSRWHTVPLSMCRERAAWLEQEVGSLRAEIDELTAENPTHPIADLRPHIGRARPDAAVIVKSRVETERMRAKATRFVLEGLIVPIPLPCPLRWHPDDLAKRFAVGDEEVLVIGEVEVQPGRDAPILRLATPDSGDMMLQFERPDEERLLLEIELTAMGVARPQRVWLIVEASVEAGKISSWGATTHPGIPNLANLTQEVGGP